MHSILFRIKVGRRNVLLIQILRNPRIDQKCLKYDSFFVKFETTIRTMPPCKNIKRSKLLITILTENLFCYHIYTHIQVIGRLIDSIMNSPVPKKLKGRFTVTEV